MPATSHIHELSEAFFRMNYRLKKNILRIPFIRKFRNFLKKTIIRRRANYSLYEIILDLSRNMKEHELIGRSNAVAYNLILAIFPAIIFIFTLIPYFSIYFPEINDDTIMAFLNTMLPKGIYDTFSETLVDTVSIQRSGLLTFGFALALYLATNGMLSMIKAFNAVYTTMESRSTIRMRLTATALTLLLALVLIITMVMIIAGEFVLDYIGSNLKNFKYLDEFTLYLFDLLRFVVAFIGLLVSISCIYYFGPAVHYNWNFFSWGSLFAAIATMLVSFGFSIYLSSFSSYNKFYGSIGAIIALMVWIQLLSVVLLAGYELNAVLHRRDQRPS